MPGQIEQVKQIDKEVKRSAKLAEFMQAHAERFGGIGDGKLLWKQLEGVRTEEDRGKIGRDNKKLLTLVKGMIKEWMTLVAGQPFKAQMAYTDIDKATKRMDQRAVLQILSRKPKFLTTSWVKTTKAGLLALGATSQIGDNYATEVGRKKLAADEPPLREAACKLLGMILDPHNKEILALIHKCTSRRCAWVCLSVCIAVLRIRTSGGACVCLRFARACSRALLRLPKTDFLETRERGFPAAGVARGSICLGSCVCVPSGGAAYLLRTAAKGAGHGEGARSLPPRIFAGHKRGEATFLMRKNCHAGPPEGCRGARIFLRLLTERIRLVPTIRFGRTLFLVPKKEEEEEEDTKKREEEEEEDTCLRGGGA